MDINNIRWGIIGVGDVTEVKSGPAYQKTDGFDIVAVMRRTPGKAEDYARRHGIKKFYTDADALINDPEVDAVYIATPPDSHKTYGLKVAAAGKPCCIEKPMAPNYSESLAIYEAFQAKQLPLFIAYYRRTLPRFVQIKTWLDNNEIGLVRHINRQLCKAPNEIDLSKQNNWRTDPKVAPGGYFDDLASHDLDLFAFLLGNYQAVKGVSLNQLDLYAAKDAVAACWLHEKGITGSGNWNFGSNDHADRVEIFGSAGKIEFSVFAEAPIVLENQNGRQELFIEHPRHVQMQHVEQMWEHLAGKKTHPSTGETGLHTSWVMDQILENIS